MGFSCEKSNREMIPTLGSRSHGLCMSVETLAPGKLWQTLCQGKDCA